MINGIQIKNFKGIDEAGIDIALAPVTMLFGSNNAGKSSVFHAFMLADEVFNNGNRSPYRIGPEGSTIDLGGFESFINGKVLDRAVTLTFQLDLSREKIDQEWPIEEALVELHGRPAGVDISTIGDDVWNGEVSIQLAWDEKAKNAFVRRYSVSLNDEHLLDIESTGIDKLVFPTNVNPAHSLLRWPEGSEDEVGIDSYGVLDGLLGEFQQTAVAVYHLSAEYSVDELPTPEDDGYVVLLENPPESDIVEVRLLVPHHEFENLPQELQETFEEIASYAPELTELELYFARYANGMIRLAGLRILSPFDTEDENAKEEADRLAEEWFGKMNEPVSLVSIVSLADALPSWHEPIRFKFLFADNPQFASMAPRFRLVTELLNRLVVVPGRIKHFLQAIAARGTRKMPIRLEYHTGNQDLGIAKFQSDLDTWIQPHLPTKVTLSVVRWDKDQMHNRYIVTERGGVMFGHGLDQDDAIPVGHDTVTLLDVETCAELVQDYSPQSKKLKWLNEIFKVSGL